jgi:hypothetical protein
MSNNINLINENEPFEYLLNFGTKLNNQNLINENEYIEFCNSLKKIYDYKRKKIKVSCYINNRLINLDQSEIENSLNYLHFPEYNIYVNILFLIDIDSFKQFFINSNEDIVKQFNRKIISLSNNILKKNITINKILENVNKNCGLNIKRSNKTKQNILNEIKRVCTHLTLD